MEYMFNLNAGADDLADREVSVKPNLWLVTPDEIPPLLFTAEDVARTLHVGRNNVFDLMRSGRLRSIRIGNSRRVTARALADFVASLDTGDLA